MAEKQLKSISDIFHDRIFRIPDYQRGYSWTEPQLDDFWEDIQNTQKGRYHYVGVLSIEAVNDEKYKKWNNDQWVFDGKGFKPFFVVDGQQRLTTIIILIKCLLDSIDDDDVLCDQEINDITKKYIVIKKPKGIAQTFIFGYETDNPSYEYLKTAILNCESSSYTGTETLYTKNLKFAKEYFAKKITDLEFNEKENLFKKITKDLRFNVYEIDDDLDVFIAFETMNNRGKPLAKLELLKNRLIYLSILIQSDQPDKDALRVNINETWKTIYEYLGRNKSKLPNDDDFLKDHWIMYFKFSKEKADEYADFLFEEMFNAKKVYKSTDNLTHEDINKYIKSLQESVKVWFWIHYPEESTYNEDIKEGLLKFNRIKRSSFIPLLLAAIQKEQSKITDLLLQIERYIYLLFIVNQSRRDAGENYFLRSASDLFKGYISIDSIISEIENRIQTHFKHEKFYEQIRDLYDDKKCGFYDWEGLRFTLYEYEESLRKKAKQNEKKISWERLEEKRKDRKSIEHILPQTITNGWEEVTQMYTDEQITKIKHSLGNLLALSIKKNASLSNNSFNNKKGISNDDSGYHNGSFQEIEVSNFPNWGTMEIFNRGVKLLEFIEKRWSIKLGDDNFKKRLLFLDFLIEKEGDAKSNTENI